ncbi:MAG: cell division protein ZapA [Alphaproteobacteria bacterium]
MAEVAVNINGRSYRVACDDGEEAHVSALADKLARHVADLVADIGQVGDTRLLLMAGLIVADELADLRLRFTELQTRSDALAAERDETTERVERLARRLEAVAAKVKGA